MKHFFFGFSPWKHPFVKPFFPEIERFIFINPLFSKQYLEIALKKGLDKESAVYIWGRKSFPNVEAYAKSQGIPLYRVEDGFIRSVGLGSDLTQPYSLVVDSRGIYFDPTQESDLEHLLNHHDFSDEELARVRKIMRYLTEKKLSKYNNYDTTSIDLPTDKKVVLVPGQVEDDASIRYGADGMTNLALLQAARQSAPDAYIIFKPHPDVLAGNRAGDIPKEEALRYCDKVVTEVSLDSVLGVADEVHTMTSLVGFEALMRGIKVHTYGMPFYAGWGLTHDVRHCARRTRTRTIEALAAATLLLYPRYIDPISKEICEIETMLRGLEEEKKRLEQDRAYRYYTTIRNFLSRKGQMLLRLVS